MRRPGCHSPEVNERGMFGLIVQTDVKGSSLLDSARLRSTPLGSTRLCSTLQASWQFVGPHEEYDTPATVNVNELGCRTSRPICFTSLISTTAERGLVSQHDQARESPLSDARVSKLPKPLPEAAVNLAVTECPSHRKC
ncbi:hypothetical protein PMIN04_006785 [Paraphaeosphaeria minitans]